MTHDPSPAAHPPTLADRLMALVWRRPAPDLGERARRRVVLYLIPYLFLLYILAYLDRVNVSVAKLGMQRPPDEGGLGFGDAVIGAGAGMFFWGYLILEIPSTRSVLTWGARWVFVRILILWGLCCVLIGFVDTPWTNRFFGWLPAVLGRVPGFSEDPNVAQFYFFRFLLGFFEGGFFPSVILYLSLWFRPQDRGKAIATFMSAIPVASLLGSPVSGLILKMDWLGLPGWRWIFILQGLAPVVAGFVTIFFLPDRPETASWLPPDEKAWLVGELHRDEQSRHAHGHFAWVGQAGVVLLLTGYYFCMNVASYGLSIFMPSIIKSQARTGDTTSSVLAGLPYLMGLLGMLVNGWHTDRTRERIAHTVVPLTMLSVGIFLAALLDGVPVWPVVVMILVVGTFMYAHLPAFWPIPTIFLGPAAAASAIGFINMTGNLGGYFGPKWVGEAAERQTSFATSLFILAPFPLLSVGFILLVGYLRRDRLRASRDLPAAPAPEPARAGDPRTGIVPEASRTGVIPSGPAPGTPPSNPP